MELDDVFTGSGDYMDYSQFEEFAETEETENYPGYRLIEKIGEGNFGRVWKAERLSDHKIVALKVVKIDPTKPNMLKNLEKEVNILTKISNPTCQPFLVCFNGYQYLEKYNEFIIDTDYIEGKTLLEFIKTVPEKNKYRYLLLIMKDLVKAIAYLHNHDIIHNDIKPENIIITKNLTPVLIDMGVACSNLSTCNLNSQGVSLCCKYVSGPNMYVSPETLRTKIYYTPSDIWSFGITFYIAATNRYPFKTSSNIKTLFQNIQTQPPATLMTSNEYLNYIVNRSLDKNPATRITVSEISEILNSIL